MAALDSPQSSVTIEAMKKFAAMYDAGVVASARVVEGVVELSASQRPLVRRAAVVCMVSIGNKTIEAVLRHRGSSLADYFRPMITTTKDDHLAAAAAGLCSGGGSSWPWLHDLQQRLPHEWQTFLQRKWYIRKWHDEWRQKIVALAVVGAGDDRLCLPGFYLAMVCGEQHVEG